MSRRPCVLLVEGDEAYGRALLDRLAGEAGFEGAGTLVPTLAGAIDALAQATFDLILLGLDLPDAPGLEAVTRLNIVAPDVPLIVLAEAAEEATALEALGHGAQEYLLRDEVTGRALGRSLRFLTHRRRAAEEVARRERFYRSLIENSSEVISILDAAGTIRYTSPSVRRILGYRPEQLLGNQLADFLHPEDVELARETLHDVVARHGSTLATVEVRIRHHDGHWRVLELTLENRLDDPVVAGVVGNARDATDRKKAEEALDMSQEQLRQFQRIEAIGRLAGGVAHDFNNLLTAMSGHIYLLQSDISEQDPRRIHLDEIRRSAERAAGLTRQLLAFSRKQVLHPRVLDLNAVVRDFEGMLRRLIGEDIELVVRTGQDLGRVRADLSQIEQVIMNLVVNARDAMPDGGRLVIETANARLGANHPRKYGYVRPGAYVLLAVEDTGHGMDERTRAQAFEPFFTTKEVGKGTGLGLATVYGIVKQSNGFIWVDSELGRGTRFEIYLPRVDEEPEALRPAVEAGERLCQGSETILLVEDEEAVRSLATGVLRRSGYTVLEADCGEEALRLARAADRRIDLLVTDVVMPRMSGKEVADALLADDPSLPVLFISGYAADALQAGFHPRHGFLQKPFTPDVFSRAVRALLDSAAAPARSPTYS
ncbi:MAG: response regulator [Gemmatimonadetes bacterium]|nr:response regulator [Gemmatimonadota bacterium]